jgi:hypothetical protein
MEEEINVLLKLSRKNQIIKLQLKHLSQKDFIEYIKCTKKMTGDVGGSIKALDKKAYLFDEEVRVTNMLATSTSYCISEKNKMKNKKELLTNKLNKLNEFLIVLITLKECNNLFKSTEDHSMKKAELKENLNVRLRQL